MRRLSILSLIFAVCFTGHLTESQVVPDNLSVSVHVTCDNEITEDLTESYIKRELRSLGDVAISDLGDYQLVVLVIAPEFISGQKTGQIVISSTFVKVYRLASILYYYAPSFYSENAEAIGKKASKEDAPPLFYDHYVNNYVVVTKTTHLQNTCKDIVAKFDTDVLEKER